MIMQQANGRHEPAAFAWYFEIRLSGGAMTPEHEHFLLALLENPALHKFTENRKHELNFGDACRFWGLTEYMKVNVIDERLQTVDRVLAELDSLLADGSDTMVSGRIVTAGDIWLLMCVQRFMKDRFERHLKIIRNKGWR